MNLRLPAPAKLEEAWTNELKSLPAISYKKRKGGGEEEATFAIGSA